MLQLPSQPGELLKGPERTGRLHHWKIITGSGTG